MTASQVIERLYDSEINSGLQSDWDGGITVWIGGPGATPGNARLSSRTFVRSEFSDIPLWLDDEARRLFPDSEYARKTYLLDQDLDSQDFVQSEFNTRRRSVFAQRE
jgi:hypothetical protein